MLRALLGVVTNLRGCPVDALLTCIPTPLRRFMGVYQRLTRRLLSVGTYGIQFQDLG